MRTVLALAEGVHRTAYWNLAPEYPGPADHLQMMHLLIGKLPLLGYRDGDLAVRHPAAQTFALLAEKMAGARAVSRVTADGPPGLYAFEVDRAGRGPLLVVWDHRDPFDGEDEPPAEVTWPWPAASRHRHRRLRPHVDRPVPGRPDPPAGLRHPPLRGASGALITELRRELAGLRRAPGLGERAVHRQPQILSVHAAIFASPMNTEPAGVFPGSTYFCPRDTLRSAGGRPARGKGAIMHPMFVELYLQADADQDEQDRRRRAARSRRLRSRTALRVAAPAPVGTAVRSSEFWHVR